MSIAQTGPEVITKGSKHAMRIDYCGGWGYRPKAMDAIGKIEQEFPGEFTYYLMRDNGATGRLEVTIWKDSTAMGETGAGALVHSKATSKMYISANYGAFIAAVGDAIGKWAR